MLNLKAPGDGGRREKRPRNLGEGFGCEMEIKGQDTDRGSTGD